LGSGQGYSVKEVIETVRKVSGHPIPTVDIERRAVICPVLVADSTRIQHELGWQPQFNTLEAIVASAWEWHKHHPNGYDD
jgi:UDP-glucose 4-epimerase